MKVRCLVIDDEKNSRENNANLITTYCPDLEVIGTASTAGEGLQLINELKPDAIFLDVRMPDFDGFSLMARLGEHKPMVVFVTAYENYALKAIKASAIDYILKPVSIKELTAAAEKLVQLHQLITENPQAKLGYNSALKLMVQSATNDNLNRIALPHHLGYRFEELKNLIRFESDSNYTTIYLSTGEKVVASKPLKHFEDFLDEKTFVRIHNSHIVNINFLKTYSREDGGMAELMDGTRLQIAKRRLPLFLDMVKHRFIKP